MISRQIRSWSRSSVNHSHRSGIAGDHAISGHQGDAFHLCLRDEYSIEGILVNQRQILDGDDVLAANGQFAIAR